MRQRFSFKYIIAPILVSLLTTVIVSLVPYIHSNFFERSNPVVFVDFGTSDKIILDKNSEVISNVHSLGFINLGTKSIENNQIYLDVKNSYYPPSIETFDPSIVANLLRDESGRYFIEIKKFPPSTAFSIKTVNYNGSAPLIGAPVALSDSLTLISLKRDLMLKHFSMSVGQYIFIFMLILTGFLGLQHRNFRRLNLIENVEK